MRLAVLIPAYQAAATLGEVLLRLQALEGAPAVLVVDDGSRDATAEVARQHGARVLSFAGNRGKGHALLAGFAALRDEFLTQGPKVAAFEEQLAAAVGARFAVAVSSGTAALLAAYAAAGVGPGRSVLTSPITFVATANASL